MLSRLHPILPSRRNEALMVSHVSSVTKSLTERFTLWMLHTGICISHWTELPSSDLVTSTGIQYPTDSHPSELHSPMPAIEDSSELLVLLLRRATTAPSHFLSLLPNEQNFFHQCCTVRTLLVRLCYPIRYFCPRLTMYSSHYSYGAARYFPERIENYDG